MEQIEAGESPPFFVVHFSEKLVNLGRARREGKPGKQI